MNFRIHFESINHESFEPYYSRNIMNYISTVIIYNMIHKTPSTFVYQIEPYLSYLVHAYQMTS